MSLETVPKDIRNLRACLLCSLVKTLDQFAYDGCDNCEEYLHMKNNRDAVYECTSSNFDGIEVGRFMDVNFFIVRSQRFGVNAYSFMMKELIAMMSPEDSWVSKWQRIARFAKGCYAVSVTGKLPPGIVRELRGKGIMYRPRDVSQA